MTSQLKRTFVDLSADSDCDDGCDSDRSVSRNSDGSDRSSDRSSDDDDWTPKRILLNNTIDTNDDSRWIYAQWAPAPTATFKWQSMFAQLQSYVREYRHLPVECIGREHREFNALWNWMCAQKTAMMLVDLRKDSAYLASFPSVQAMQAWRIFAWEHVSLFQEQTAYEQFMKRIVDMTAAKQSATKIAEECAEYRVEYEVNQAIIEAEIAEKIAAEDAGRETPISVATASAADL